MTYRPLATGWHNAGYFPAGPLALGLCSQKSILERVDEGTYRPVGHRANGYGPLLDNIRGVLLQYELVFETVFCSIHLQI